MRVACAAGLAMVLAGCAGESQSYGARGEPARLEGANLARVYAAIERVYRSEAKFRTDYDPSDAPYDAEMLARNFIQVAQRSETQITGSTTLVEGRSIPLTRWEMPIRVWTSGATPADRAHMSRLTGRIGVLTDLSVEIARDAAEANVYILVAGPEERRELVDLIASLGRSGESPLVAAWPDLPEFPCIARVFIDPERNTMQWAMIFVKAELSGDFRKSCLTEEFVQSLGLFNDGPDIRPSIFNDDAEFIELTRHDEYLVQILYDRRLRPGMLREQTEPIVRVIAAELLADAGT